MSEDKQCRCPWLDDSKPDYVKYHDEEWGIPVHDDKKMFEFIILESAQAGLSWYTILKRREGYKQAFSDFDVNEVAAFNEEKITELIQNPAIIRHQGKIKAAINNAKVFIKIQQEFGSFSQYLWNYIDDKTLVNNRVTIDDYPSTSPLSDAISGDLKKRGFKFFGSTICYAHLQACGLINDHSINCYKRSQIIAKYQQG